MNVHMFGIFGKEIFCSFHQELVVVTIHHHEIWNFSLAKCVAQ